MKKTKKLKRNLVLGAAGILVFLLTACGSNGDATNLDLQDSEKETVTQTNEEKNGKTAKHYKNNSVLFSTEYDVEDYYEGCFIVSKSDGMLFGALDMEGKEILPIKYDNIEFINKDKVCNGTNDMLYMQTRYENEYEVVDLKGKTVMNGLVSCVSYVFGGNDKDSPFFEKKGDNGEIEEYKENGELLYKLGDADVNNSCHLISKDYYLLSKSSKDMSQNKTVRVNYKGAGLYDKNNNLIKEWPDGYVTNGMKDDETYIFSVANNDSSAVVCYMDAYGNITDEKKMSINEMQSFWVNLAKSNINVDREKRIVMADGDRVLYSSNGKWKLVDSSGNAVYDERYYEAMTGWEGNNDCYLLSNEDKQYCLIDRNGVLRVDYGNLKITNGYISLNGNSTNNKIYEGGKSVCFVVKNAEKNDIYFFNGQ